MTTDNSQNNAGEQVIFATGGYDHTIKVWQAHTGVCQRTFQHTDSVNIFCFVYVYNNWIFFTLS